MKWLVCLLIAFPMMAVAVETENIQAPNVLVNESEIPVTLEAVKKTDATENPFMKMGITFAVISILAGGAFFLIKKYSFSNAGKNQNNQIKIITQHYLGPRKSIAMIRVAGESMLVGITDTNISLIKTLSLLDEDIPNETPSQFSRVFSQTANQNIQAAGSIEPAEDFSITGIKDFVTSKLKNMRSLE
jgi:flagellar protein FliO/FliZ